MQSGRLLAIGDIHACHKTFSKLLDTIKLDRSDQCVLMGDYIDRGPDSRSLLDLIIELKADGYDIVTLMGNHERMMQLVCRNQIDFGLWENNGAMKTLKSLGIKHLSEIPIRYMDFLDSLLYYHKTQDYVFVHGGLNFGSDDPFADNEYMLWARPAPVNLQKTGGRKLVVGHTPATIEVISISLSTDLIRLDGGCVYTDRNPELGKLCCYDFSNERLYYLKNIDT